MHLIQTPAAEAKTPIRVSSRRSSETAIGLLADRDLEELRRALARPLRGLTVGSPGSQLVGRLSKLVRAEQRRHERQRAGPPEAA